MFVFFARTVISPVSETEPEHVVEDEDVKLKETADEEQAADDGDVRDNWDDEDDDNVKDTWDASSEEEEPDEG